VKPIRVEFRFLTIDYALWEGRWWMPRLIAMDAVATAGSFLQMPMRYERVYDDYEVDGRYDAAPRRAPAAADRRRGFHRARGLSQARGSRGGVVPVP
jgi:hypothetical protein